jgi:hypothetical protein
LKTNYSQGAPLALRPWALELNRFAVFQLLLQAETRSSQRKREALDDRQ